MIIRPARTLDAGAIADILSSWIDQTAWMPRIHTRAEDLSFCATMIERDWVSVADSGNVMGFLAREGEYVHALYVHHDHRRSGVGSSLLHAAQKVVPRLELWTFQANIEAQRFYHMHGFDEAERTDGAGNDEGLPDVKLIWEKQ
jgi:GNAT superfamily N-acetyltransferase